MDTEAPPTPVLQHPPGSVTFIRSPVIDVQVGCLSGAVWHLRGKLKLVLRSSVSDLLDSTIVTPRGRLVWQVSDSSPGQPTLQYTLEAVNASGAALPASSPSVVLLAPIGDQLWSGTIALSLLPADTRWVGCSNLTPFFHPPLPRQPSSRHTPAGRLPASCPRRLCTTSSVPAPHACCSCGCTRYTLWVWAVDQVGHRSAVPVTMTWVTLAATPGLVLRTHPDRESPSNLADFRVGLVWPTPVPPATMVRASCVLPWCSLRSNMHCCVPHL